VIFPVNFNDKIAFCTEEICNEIRKRMLPPEFESMKPSASKIFPEYFLLPSWPFDFALQSEKA